MSERLRVLFVVQGEGRGHMTQALAVGQMLARAGHTVCAVLVGTSPARQVPQFFSEGVGGPTISFPSPNFAYHPTSRAVCLRRTLTHGLARAPNMVPAFGIISETLRTYRPDVVLNFYEGLFGLYMLIKRPPTPVLSIAHQYMFFHPAYPIGAMTSIEKEAALSFTRLTALGSACRLALSLYPATRLPDSRLRIVPPLLRSELFDLPPPTDDGFVLAYLLAPHLAENLAAWHARRRDVAVHCFWDRERWSPHENLTFHPLDGRRFLELMGRARAVVCTAGFETVSEAMWLGKPLYLVPTPGHFEQRVNALDAVRVGAGMTGPDLDLDDFLAALPNLKRPAAGFRAWVASAEALVMREIETLAWQRAPAPAGWG